MAGGPRILLVEDDDALAEGLVRQLSRAGFSVERIADGDVAVGAAIERFDLAILDLMLPGTYGLDVLKRWRARGAEGALPVILLTARDHTADKVRGLSLGADDYVTKPFYPEELLARVQARLRRAQPTGSSVLRCGALELDLEAHVARVDGAPLELTRVELAILVQLAERMGRAISRSELALAALDRDEAGSDRALDVHVSRIRKKLGPHAEQLATVWGVGYRLESEPRKKSGR